MKPKKEFFRCEFCDKEIPCSSPPPRASYEKGEVHITGGHVLLYIAEGGNHAGDLEGCYCNVECLANHIRTIRGDMIEKKVECSGGSGGSEERHK